MSDDNNLVEFPKPKLLEPPPKDAPKGVQVRGQKLTRAERRTRILELRAAGMTEDQIAAAVGMTQGGVSNVIIKALKDWAEKDSSNVELVRQQKLYELDQLKRAIWPRALRGELAAVREATKIIQVQARISGAEAPVKVEREVTLDIGIDRNEIARMERAWLDSGGSIIDGAAEEIIQGEQ